MKKALRTWLMIVSVLSVLTLFCCAADVFYGFDGVSGGWWTNLAGSKMENGIWKGTTNTVNNIIQNAFSDGHLKGEDHRCFVMRIRYDAGAYPRSLATYLYIACDDENKVETSPLWTGTVRMNQNVPAEKNGEWQTLVYDFSSYAPLMNGYIKTMACGVGNASDAAQKPVQVEIDYIALTDKPYKTVTFIDPLAASGAAVPQNVTAVIGTVFDPAAYTMSSPDYRFVGWKTSLDGELVDEPFLLLTDTTLYAVWLGVATKTVTFVPGADDVYGLPEGNMTTVYAGTTVSALPVPARDGYRFSGYALTADGAALDGNTAIGDDVTLYALWEGLAHHTLTLHANTTAAVTGLPESGKLIRVGDIKVYELPVPHRNDGIIFRGWAESENGDYLAPATVLGEDADLYAVWSPGIAYEFDGGKTDGATPNSHLTCEVKDGMLVCDTTGGDPYISMYLNAVPDLHGALVIGMRMSGLKTSSAIQVYASYDNKSLNESNSVKTPVTAAGQPGDITEYRFDFHTVPYAAGASRLTMLRLDPVTVAGVHLEIAYIRVVPDADSFVYFTANGGEGSMGRLLPEGDGCVTLPECGFTHPTKFFEKWSDENGDLYDVGSTVTVGGIVNIFPKWGAGPLGDIDLEYYPGFVRRALIMSYDDGNVEGDEGMIAHLNKGGMKCSFNLETAAFTPSGYETVRKRYEGHEIANHTVHHMHLNVTDPGDATYVNDTNAIRELSDAKAVLEAIAGYEVKGLAWPYTCPAARSVILSHAESEYEYARGASTGVLNFDVPTSFFPNWNFTCYQIKQGVDTFSENSRLLYWMKRYIDYDAKDKLSLFSVWGHSSEYVRNVLPWSELETFVSLYEENLKDICWNPAVIDYVRYMKARKQLVQAKTYLYNPTGVTLYLKSDERPITLASGALFDGRNVYDGTAVDNKDGTVSVKVAVDLRSVESDAVYTFTAAFDAEDRLLGVSQKKAVGGTVNALDDTVTCGDAARKVIVFTVILDGSVRPVTEPIICDIQ